MAKVQIFWNANPIITDNKRKFIIMFIELDPDFTGTPFGESVLKRICNEFIDN